MVPDGEGAPGWTIQEVKESSDKHRKVSVSKTVKIKHTKLLLLETPDRLRLTYLQLHTE